MMDRALPRAAGRWSGSDAWRRHLGPLCVVALAILLLFRRDVADMASIWWNASTFGHCLFIPAILAWLVHQRLPGLRQLQPVAWAPGLLWLATGAFIWLLGQAAGVAMFRHVALIVMLQGATMAMLGPAVAQGLLFPLFYAFFMVPAGEEIIPPLQLLTARICMTLLDLWGVAARLDGIFITTPHGYFRVAEACSGAKFVIAMAAYGILVCNVCFVSWGRRILFLCSALVLSVLANGVRAFATILVAQYRGVDAAKGFDHVLYGWIFFAIVMTLVMAAAWPFFDRDPGGEWFNVRLLKSPVRERTSPLAASGSALVLMAAAPIWLALSAAATPPLARPSVLPAVKGWALVPDASSYPWKPRFDGADHLRIGHYRNEAGEQVDLAIALFDRQGEGRELVGFAQGAADPDGGWSWSSPAPAPANAMGEQITGPGPTIRHVVSFYMVGHDAPTGSATRVKLATMKARLLGGDQRAAAILISAEQGRGASADRAIGAFLRDLGEVKDLADRSLGIG